MPKGQVTTINRIGNDNIHKTSEMIVEQFKHKKRLLAYI